MNERVLSNFRKVQLKKHSKGHITHIKISNMPFFKMINKFFYESTDHNQFFILL